VDLLRGLIMVIMALDHTRDYFTNVHFDPTDLSQTTPALFFTRWITHYCAPVFVFLAGTGAYLSTMRGKTRGQLARFLWTRGLWLIVLELTVVRFAWTFNLHYAQVTFVQVIWALGWSMIALAGLIYLPMWAITAFSVLMIAGHNLLDPITPDAFGGHGPLSYGFWGWLWAVLHVQAGPIVYPLIPWIGVMAAGYAFGSVYRLEAAERRRLLLRLGALITVGFVLLRYIDRYGDPTYWTRGQTPIHTMMSFLNVVKYPPSLLYLMMTLGPSIALLAFFERLAGPVGRFFTVYGRVPMFYYIVHLYVIHGLVLVLAGAQGLPVGTFFNLFFAYPRGWGYSLPVVYLIWMGVVLALYAPCRWFAGVKRRSRAWWISYI
jgi:uncharacterized membrane protein